MLDEIRRDIQTRLDQLLAEADKLRHALAALGSHDRAAPSAGAVASSAPRSRRSASVPRAARSSTRGSSRNHRGANSNTPSVSAEPAEAQSTKSSESAAAPRLRSASGATKTAVLAALAAGSPMTAGEVANATGLGRASVSTTLSKLSKSGEVTKAARGYELAGHATTGAAASAAEANA